MRLCHVILVVVCLVFASAARAGDCPNGLCPLKHPVQAAKATVDKVVEKVKDRAAAKAPCQCDTHHYASHWVVRRVRCCRR